MARFDIQSIDRLGITQEILALLAQQNWDLGAVEMHLHHTYVDIRDVGVSRRDILAVLRPVDGVRDVQPVALLPTEVRREQLKTLLSHIPNPIIQLDREDRIVDLNEPAQRIFGFATEYLEGRPVSDVAGNAFPEKILRSDQHVEVQLKDRAYVANIAAIASENTDEGRAGTVIVLHSMNQVGQQISAVQGDIKGIVGASPEMKRVHDQSRRIAASDFPILILGETGTGKELIARSCHDQSPRGKAPFLALNCAAIPENLLESELFGYAPGAFSGAQRGGKPGLVELAEGGTVFLDEIGEMSPYLQAKLLRFLQDYSYRRVGGQRERHANIRIISATHRDLEEKVASGEFREDLYYRLNVLKLDVPPLRDRQGDIALLARHFTEKAAAQAGCPCPQIDDRGVELLTSFSWPGNVRQLENTIFRAVVLSEGDALDHELLLPTRTDPSAPPDANIAIGAADTFDEAQSAFEKGLLERLWPLYPSTRKLGDRLKVSHNKIAILLRKHGLRNR